MARILVVDDAKFMRIKLATLLERENHEIIGQAENGLEAVKLYKKNYPELVTMDITMPVMNGIDAIKKIIKFDSNAKIIVCSAIGQQKVVVEAIELGAKDFIVKPFNDEIIIETINQVLSGKDESISKKL